MCNDYMLILIVENILCICKIVIRSVIMDLKNVSILSDKNSVVLKYQNEKIMLFKSKFEKHRVCYFFLQENASDEFAELVLNNLEQVGIEMDMQSKKYFIDAEDERSFEHIFEKLGYNLHFNFSNLFFKSYSIN